MNPNIFDIIIIILLALGAVSGFTKGFITSAAGLLALLLGVWGGLKFSYIIGNWLADHTEFSERTIAIISFIVIFIVIVSLVKYGGKRTQQVGRVN
jgi:membrane protein required for colicin V production